MKENIEKLCQLYREHINIPVFENSLPEGFSSECIVIREDPENKRLKKDEYHINVYVPNKVRMLGDYKDRSYPDFKKLDYLEDQVLMVLEEYGTKRDKFSVHIRKYIKEGEMHLLDLCLYPL